MKSRPMAKGNLTEIGCMMTPPLQPAVSDATVSGDGAGRADFAPHEGVRLIRAFARIADSAKRARLIAQAEAMAAAKPGATA
jgi:hypothetical protein